MELTKSLKAYLYDKTTSPLYSTLIVSWCLWNWRIFYVTLFVSEAEIGNKLKYIDCNLIGWGVSFFFPLLSATFIITVVPWLSNWTKLLTLTYELWLKKRVNEKENTSVLTIPESIALRLEIENEKVRFYQSMGSKDKDLEGQRNTIEALSSQLANFKKENTGLRVLRAEFGVEGAFYDVTEKLNSMIKNDTLELKADISIFGDPKPNVTKQLSVIYIHDGSYHSKVMNEGDPKTILINKDMASIIDKKSS